MFWHTNPEKRHGNMWGADFFYGAPYRAFRRPSVGRVDDIDVGKNLRSPCGEVITH